LGRLRRPVCLTFLLLLVLAWLLGIGLLYLSKSRYGETRYYALEPFRQLGQDLADSADRSCLVIVHSIPSGVAGIARYMEAHDASAKGIGFASWVGQLKQRRVPDDLQSLAAGSRRVILVKIHEVDEPAPQEVWLRAHARLVGEQRFEGATVLRFVPRDADRFAHESAVHRPQGGPVGSIADRSICDLMPVSILYSCSDSGSVVESRTQHTRTGRSVVPAPQVGREPP
jgi:hypothetical protein